ncbi:hypothetical protein AGMMS50267_14650 [Spirochaetia bacterium]|nr:hypothetical protein AGMMS50267_14650 [Spirochaetia bacterium]
MRKRIKSTTFYKILRNINFLIKHDFQQELNDTRYEIETLKLMPLTTEILNYYKANPELSLDYKAELSYIRENKAYITFPYKHLRSLGKIHSGYNKILKLPFVIHNNKKLYFPSTWSVKYANDIYRNFIENENILGGAYREKSPHQYQTGTFHIHKGDTLLDIGAAEALVSLDAIDKIKRLYLIESDPLWIEPLNATFRPYKEKVTIINKLISDIDSDSTITLASLLKNEELSALFIKMDIEGYETSVIEASKDVLSRAKDIRIACCTYHKHNDAAVLNSIFTALNYKTEYSDGYMLFTIDELKPPYFRKGIIRAEKE